MSYNSFEQFFTGISQDRWNLDDQFLTLKDLEPAEAQFLAALPSEIPFQISQYDLQTQKHNYFPLHDLATPVPSYDKSLPAGEKYSLDLKVPLAFAYDDNSSGPYSNVVRDYLKTKYPTLNLDQFKNKNWSASQNSGLQQYIEPPKHRTQATSNAEDNSKEGTNLERFENIESLNTPDDKLAADTAMATAGVGALHSAGEITAFNKVEKIPGRGLIPIKLFYVFLGGFTISLAWLGLIRFYPLPASTDVIISSILDTAFSGIFLLTTFVFFVVTWFLMAIPPMLKGKMPYKKSVIILRGITLLLLNSAFIVTLLTMAGGDFPSIVSGRDLTSPLLGPPLESIEGFSGAFSFLIDQWKSVPSRGFFALSDGVTALSTWPNSPVIHIMLWAALWNYGQIIIAAIGYAFAAFVQLLIRA